MGVSGRKIAKRKYRGGKGEIWINRPYRILAEGRPGGSGMTWGVVQHEIRYRGQSVTQVRDSG